jgi:hypothetical protein
VAGGAQLARGEGEGELVDRCVVGRRGPGAADRAGEVADAEAVPVPGVGLEAVASTWTLWPNSAAAGSVPEATMSLNALSVATSQSTLWSVSPSDHPEFDAWRWNEYWVPLDVVIEFKRGVYEMALTELARFLPRVNHHNRFLRAGMRHARPDEDLRGEPTGSPVPEAPN